MTENEFGLVRVNLKTGEILDADGKVVGLVVPPWQSIETAPKDGTSVLCMREGYQPGVYQWRTIGDQSKWTQDPETFMEEEHFMEYWGGTEYKPDYWMPLPSAHIDLEGVAVRR